VIFDNSPLFPAITASPRGHPEPHHRGVTVISTHPIHPQVPASVSLRPDLFYRGLHAASCFQRTIGFGAAKKWAQVSSSYVPAQHPDDHQTAAGLARGNAGGAGRERRASRGRGVHPQARWKLWTPYVHLVDHRLRSCRSGAKVERHRGFSC